MFGYLVAASELLEEEQQQRYRECYCGLCRSLDRCFGSAARLTLNYDLTFLVLLLSSLYEPEEEHGESVCPRHPAKRQQWMTNEISDYAANMNVALAYLKCLDDWHDDRSLTAYAEARTLKRWYEEISERYPRQCDAMQRSIEKLGEIEKSGRCEPDAAADTFGELMEQLFIYKDDRWSDTLAGWLTRWGASSTSATRSSTLRTTPLPAAITRSRITPGGRITSSASGTY